MQTIEPMQHLERIASEWFEAKQSGGTLIIEKARRMVVSWWVRCLELHQMGLGRRDWLLGGDGYAPACKHIWRHEHLYEDMQARFGNWKLPDHRALHFEGERSLKWFSLANGSQCSAVNGQGSKVQGEGIFGVTLEEGSLYPYLESMVGQSKIVTEGSPGSVGGFVTIIANPEPNYPWQVLKSGGKDQVAAFGS